MRARWGLACLSMVACAPAPAAPSPAPTALTAAALVILPLTSVVASSLEPPRWSPGGVLKHLPARCELGRAYANLHELLAGGGAQALARLAQSKLPLTEEGNRMRAIASAFEEGGTNPYAAMKEVAFCFDRPGGASMAALRIDLSKIEKPSEVLIRSLTKHDGKPPKVETAGGFVWIGYDKGKTVAVGEDLLLLGDDRKTIESGIDRGVDSEVADASKHVLWARIREKDSTVKLSGAGPEFELEIEVQLGAAAATTASSWQAMVPLLERMVDDPKIAAFAPLMPAARRATIQASGERVTISTRMSKTVVRELLQGLADSPGSDLEGGF